MQAAKKFGTELPSTKFHFAKHSEDENCIFGHRIRMHMVMSENSHKTIPELNHQIHAFRQISTRIIRFRRLKINEKLFDAILFSIY